MKERVVAIQAELQHEMGTLKEELQNTANGSNSSLNCRRIQLQLVHFLLGEKGLLAHS